MRWILVLFLVLCFGCAGHQVKSFRYVEPVRVLAPVRSYKIWVDREFDSTDRKDIMAAVLRWDRSLNGYIRLEVVDWDYGMEIGPIEESMRGGGWIVLKLMSSNPLASSKDIIRVGKKPIYAIAWVNEIAGNRVYVVRERVCLGCLYAVMLHEIGHLLGAVHDGELLMRPEFSSERYRCIDYESIKRVAFSYGLDIRKLSYCVYE